MDCIWAWGNQKITWHPSMHTWQQQALTETNIVIKNEAGEDIV
jgi:hypothetical protein